MQKLHNDFFDNNKYIIIMKTQCGKDRTCDGEMDMWDVLEGQKTQ